MLQTIDPGKILSYTVSVQQELPASGSHGRLCRRQGRKPVFCAVGLTVSSGVGMNPTTGVAVPVLQFGSQFAQIDYKTSGGTGSL